MARTLTYEETQAIPTGDYEAVITEVEEDEGQFGEQYKYIFQITNGEAKGTNLFGWSSQKLSKKSKYREWAVAALGRTIGPGDELTVDDLVGKPIRITVLREAADDGSEYNKVKSVLPPTIGQKKRTPTAGPVAEEVPQENLF
mgnify:CR=1 FL=1